MTAGEVYRRMARSWRSDAQQRAVIDVSAHAQFRIKVHAEIASWGCRRDVMSADPDHVDRKLVLPAWWGEPKELGLVGIEL